MNNDLERLELRGRMLETVIQQAVQINELKTQLLKRTAKKKLKHLRRERRLQLQCLAELDQINADVLRQIELEENQ